MIWREATRSEPHPLLSRAVLHVTHKPPLLTSGTRCGPHAPLQCLHVTHMPPPSSSAVLHVVQMARAKRFQMFDYGSPRANMAAYGSARPPDLAAMYGHLAGIPVDLVAGLKDGIIPPENIRIHHARMCDAGLEVQVVSMWRWHRG